MPKRNLQTANLKYLEHKKYGIMEFSAKQIAEYVQGVIDGDENATVHTFAKIEEGMPGAISFLSNPKYTHYIYNTQSSIVLVNKDFVPEQEVKATLIRVDNAYESLAKLLTLYETFNPKKTGIDSLAYIAPTAKVGKDVYVGPFACVGDGAVIGDNTALYPHATVGDHAKVGNNCILYPHATIYHDCRVGNNCILHAGSVIGADGFGFAPSPEGYEKIPQIGITIIEDDVEIGVNTCVDRATMGATIVHKGVKLDNLVQIAHNVEVGSNTVMASQVGVAGSTKIGEWCMFAGQVGLAGHIRIGDKVNFGAQAGVPGNVKSGQTVLGTPAINARNFMKSSVYYKRLPEIVNELEEMKEKIDELKKQLNK